jgi:hypothetical protein
MLDDLRKVDPDAVPIDEPFGTVTFSDPMAGQDVVVGHQQVPYLRAMPQEDGSLYLILDQRFGLHITDPDQFQSVTHFVAEAIAIGAGLASIERTDIRMAFRR